VSEAWEWVVETSPRCCGSLGRALARGAGVFDYGAAKAALVNLTKGWRRTSDRTPSGSTPSPLARPRTNDWRGAHGVAATVANATGVDAETARETSVGGMGGFATGRFTTPEEVATLITLLASKRTANVTGANYVIDGGLIKTT
jgi:NAD(P)-dependent dehydrogenase (short-subunit alcohol dehydrogenase family)